MCKVELSVLLLAKKLGDRECNSRTSAKVARGEGRLKTTIQIKMIIEGNLSEEQKEELIKQADRCYIHRLLTC